MWTVVQSRLKVDGVLATWLRWNWVATLQLLFCMSGVLNMGVLLYRKTLLLCQDCVCSFFFLFLPPPSPPLGGCIPAEESSSSSSFSSSSSSSSFLPNEWNGTRRGREIFFFGGRRKQRSIDEKRGKKGEEKESCLLWLREEEEGLSLSLPEKNFGSTLKEKNERRRRRSTGEPWNIFPTTNGGMRNGSSVGICTRCMHVFAHLGAN